jgi:hypothetical protein
MAAEADHNRNRIAELGGDYAQTYLDVEPGGMVSP